MITGRALITVLGYTQKLFDKLIEGGEIPFEGCTSPMVNLGMGGIKHINTDIITHKKLSLFIGRTFVILLNNYQSVDAKYEKGRLK